MLNGLKTKSRTSPYVHLDYIINLLEIKPWPPSKSLRSLRSVLIQWEHGNKSSGSTKAVVPSNSFGLGTDDGKIEFNESFRLHVTLSRDMSVKSAEYDTFVKNCIEFNLYEPRRDKTVKGQLLATAVIDFAEYGIVQECLMISVPMNCKRTFGKTAQPMLFVKMQVAEKNNLARSSSTIESLFREESLEKNHSESVSALMDEEYAEEAETVSMTDDDDVSSQSSIVAGLSLFGSNGSLTPPRENMSEAICGRPGKVNDQEISVRDKRAAYEERISSSKDLYSEIENARTTLSNLRNSRFTMLSQNAESHSMKLLKSSIDSNGTDEQSFTQSKKLDASHTGQESQIIKDNGRDTDRLDNVKSVSSSLDAINNIGSIRTSNVIANNGSLRTSKILEKFKNASVQEQKSLRKDVSKVQDLERRVQALEGELTEAAAIEVGLYSIVPEHGSSINKVHSPARRLSRLYLHACKENSLRRASSAKSIVSGLILVVKACGSDVPRLTFWLSNSVVLRAILYKSLNGSEGEDPHMVISALEKVESWIFSRIIESIWWQTFAPYMHSAAAKGIARVVESESNKHRQTPDSLDHEQMNTSLELWKTAFMDACERICPVRSTGHSCGCLSVLSMLIMEQCVGRLDVAMFNAILREPEDEVPTDPLSDPISDSRVLPIPSGKASFGAGAQLKKTIGNWSSWLTDLFGSPITFHLLTSLSELMMLPKDMLLSNTIRKEVCPTIGIPLIKRIVDSFVPDEFCPDPIPEVVLEILYSEDLIESSEDCVRSLPCAATPTVYHPPSASLIGCILGDDGSQARLSRSGSLTLRKSNTSDDELDELDLPLTSIIDSPRTVTSSTKHMWTLKDIDSCNTVRYRLLRQVWLNCD
uniref:uncharacterized protein LOC122579278 n=1 Tax=Erigeron canadensis TaxID=72917 RepID=UPI001CB89741|nr:uncharacterized protein LOC122579278 [Erigeron canadensis]XP_043607347.1 uncharacterized protein LOC122579278 [Erigeron canadensis]XP_043607348.1 uncharacterized protein LOC122579278 [Erigeron canadensis]